MNVARATAADAVGPTNIFTIAGGYVQVTALFGVVTILRAGALATTIFNHSVGPTPLCVATPTIASPVGTIIALTGNVLDPAVISVPVAGVSNPVQGTMMGSQNPGNPTQQIGMIMGTGTITVTISVVTAGATRYFLSYVPLDIGASVVAA
ncbi:MAG: hypothetical protein PHG61_00300 [Candidatus Marinimicrobia bacterium]|nr:hypothetical protein [Candidatus Neomarinimicrobiota bacterium]